MIVSHTPLPPLGLNRTSVTMSSSERLPRVTTLLSRLTTLVFLLVSMLLTLLVLLTPTPNKHLTFFNLTPTGETRVLVVSTPTGNRTITPSGTTNNASVENAIVVNINSTSDAMAYNQSNAVMGFRQNGSTWWWLGEHGPNIWVGALRKSRWWLLY